jgi:membrane protein YdbS with pleckstrin-like domain
MASVRVDTAGAARVGHSIDIPYLETDVANRLMGRLYDEAGRTAFRW